MQSQKETEHLAPYFLPDGRHYIFLAVSSQRESGIYVGRSIRRRGRVCFAAESRAALRRAGLPALQPRQRGVRPSPSTPMRWTLSGEAVRVADGVPYGAGTPGATAQQPQPDPHRQLRGFPDGRARHRTRWRQRQSAWRCRRTAVARLDRSDAACGVGQVGTAGTYAGVDLSPDGKRFAVHRHEGTGGDSWSFDLAQGRMQRLTFDTTQDNSSPLWSPDGTRIAFASRRDNKWGLYVKSADGTGNEELIVDSIGAEGADELVAGWKAARLLADRRRQLDVVGRSRDRRKEADSISAVPIRRGVPPGLARRQMARLPVERDGPRRDLHQAVSGGTREVAGLD